MPSQLFSPGTVVTSTWLNEADISTHPQLSSVAGTNAITGAGPVSLLSYVTGQTFRFIPALTNTTAATININGLGVKSITKYGSTALVAGDLLVGMVAEIVYDGTNFQLSNPRAVSTNVTGRLIAIQRFTSTGLYTPSPGVTTIQIELIGGGGQGGGAAVTGAGQVSAGSGGGAGGYTRALLPVSSQTVTIGAGGSTSVSGNGQTGGTSSFGAVATALGGGGGIQGSAFTAVAVIGGTGGGPGVGGSILQLAGANAPICYVASTSPLVSGKGADSPYGQGGFELINLSSNGAGASLTGYGSGGGGASNGSSQVTARAGGTGSPGLCIVYEYS